MPFLSLHYFKARKTSSYKVPELAQSFCSTTANNNQEDPTKPFKAPVGNIDTARTQSEGEVSRQPAVERTPGLLWLPPEILLIISALLTRYGDLNSLILTHPCLASILSSVLYRRALSPSGYGGPFLLRAAVIASAHSRLQIFLTSYGVDPNDTLTTGWREQTLLHIAIFNSDIASARILLEAGINVDATDSTTSTALHLASRSGNVEMISLLASHGANLEAVDNENRTPLHRALGSGSRSRAAAVSALLRLGASPNSLVRVSCFHDARILGWSPLHLAAVDCLDPQAMIRLLVEHGADVEQPLLNTDPPCTPLALVAEFLVAFRLANSDAVRRSLKLVDREYKEHWKAVELLLEKGADIGPALLAMGPRPNLAPVSDMSNIGNQHPVFVYIGVLPSQTFVYKQDQRFSYIITENMWEAEGECVKKGLERARARVRRSKLSHISQRITALTCWHLFHIHIIAIAIALKS